MQEKKKKEKVQSLCMPQHNHGRMIPHVGSSCIFIGFLLPPSLTFVSVSELICHGSWFCVFLTQYQLIFLEGWWEIQYGHVFFLFGFYQPYQLVCSYMVGLFIFYFFFSCVVFSSWSVSLALLFCQVLCGLFPWWGQSIFSHTCYSCGDRQAAPGKKRGIEA